VQHLPGLYVLGAGIASLALGGAVRVATSSLGGAYLAWAYLRFVQTRNGVRWVVPLAWPGAGRRRTIKGGSPLVTWHCQSTARGCHASTHRLY
jgi:hypothetical protein